MARTKKVGITGRFGARYGRKAKRSVKIIEENMKKNHVCPKCDRPYVKRQAAGIWKCRKCGAVFTGGAYVPETPLTFLKLQWQNLQHVVSEIFVWRNRRCIDVHVVEQK